MNGGTGKCGCLVWAAVVSAILAAEFSPYALAANKKSICETIPIQSIIGAATERLVERGIVSKDQLYKSILSGITKHFSSIPSGSALAPEDSFALKVVEPRGNKCGFVYRHSYNLSNVKGLKVYSPRISLDDNAIRPLEWEPTETSPGEVEYRVTLILTTSLQLYSVEILAVYENFVPAKVQKERISELKFQQITNDAVTFQMMEKR